MPRENVLILSDSVVNFNRKIKCKISKGLQSERARFIYFPGATSKDLLHYIYTIYYIYYIFALYIYTIYYHSFEVAIIHIGVSLISNRNSPDFDLVLKNIQKYRSYDIENIFICYKKHVTEDVIRKVNELIKDICKVKRCFYVSNDNIAQANLFKGGLHLFDNCKQILASIFVFNVNRNFLMPCTFHPNVHLMAA